MPGAVSPHPRLSGWLYDPIIIVLRLAKAILIWRKGMKQKKNVLHYGILFTVIL
jgi:hypothetical protein